MYKHVFRNVQFIIANKCRSCCVQHTQFKALFQLNYCQTQTNCESQAVRPSVRISVRLLVCLPASLSGNWQMQLQRLRNWVWQCLPRTQLGSCFPSTHSTGPYKSDPCADWAALISASSSSSVSYPQQLFVSVHLMHNFRLQLNKSRTKRVTSVASVAMATLFFAFSAILCFYSTRIKLQNVLASKKK